MRVLVLGATGATGRHLLEQALAQGHQVTALARNPAKLHRRPPNLTVVQGDVTDPLAVERAVRSQDAVLCALGASTPLKHDPTLVAGIHHLVQAMERLGVRRLVYLSFLGVHHGRGQLSLLGRYVAAPLLLGKVAADHDRKEAIIQHSTLEWVIVRPPRLTNGRRTGTYRSGEDIQATSSTPRGAVRCHTSGAPSPPRGHSSLWEAKGADGGLEASIARSSGRPSCQRSVASGCARSSPRNEARTWWC